MSDTVAVAQDVWDALKKRSKLVDTGQSFYGMKVYIDPELKPGEWKLVPPKRPRSKPRPE